MYSESYNTLSLSAIWILTPLRDGVILKSSIVRSYNLGLW